MKIAVPTRGAIVDAHFGHCEAFTVFTINIEKKIEKTEMIPSPQGCGCKSNIAEVLSQNGVKIMLAGNMGSGAVNVLTNYGIEVVRGCSGNVNQLVDAYLKGGISDSGIGCQHHDHHGEGNVCNH